jgi:hypothetical protein
MMVSMDRATAGLHVFRLRFHRFGS